MAVSRRDMIKAHFLFIYILVNLGLAVRAVIMLAPVSWFGEGWLGQSCAIVVHGAFGRVLGLRIYEYTRIRILLDGVNDSG